ncbi:MAG: hypothetical protein K9N07_11580 [Candidatus Cloacimonetes bacterium]|nr:hypothetical protein [Candidatus Cloacimonadota bacterium]
MNNKKYQITKVENTRSGSSTDHIFVDSREELIDHLENKGILSIDIYRYAPFDDSQHCMDSKISIQNITGDIFQKLITKQDWQPFIVPCRQSPYPGIPKNKMIEETYLPFKESQISKYFSNIKHVDYFKKSAKKYEIWKNNSKLKNADFKEIRQIEKDERFWITQTFIQIFEQIDLKKVKIDLKNILVKAFGEIPPIDFTSWDEALKVKNSDDFVLKFEENIPSPKIYKEYLSNNLQKRQIIPYIIESGRKADGNFRKNLEGPTNVDALIINTCNGFNIFIEAKVLSDISYDVSYDVIRNQIARNIDVMLTDNKEHYKGYRFKEDDARLKMDSEKSLFILITPRIFKENTHSRFYGYKIESYKNLPLTLMADLPHRGDIQPSAWKEISERISWLTWSDVHEINHKCCPWVN